MSPPWQNARLLAYGLPRQVLHFLRTNSHSPATLEKLMQILNGSPIDFLRIDGDHTYKGVKHDFDFYSPLVAPDGLIAFHDIVPALHNDACQVHVFWGEIKDRYRHVEFVEREGNRAWRSWGGIGVLDWGRAQIPRDIDSRPGSERALHHRGGRQACA